MEWRKSEHFSSFRLLYVTDGVSWRYSHYRIRSAYGKLYVVDYRNHEVARFTCRTDAREYAEMRAEIDMEELTSS